MVDRSTCGLESVHSLIVGPDGRTTSTPEKVSLVLHERFFRTNIDRGIEHNLYVVEHFYERWILDDLVNLYERNSNLFSQDFLRNHKPLRYDPNDPLEIFGCDHLLSTRLYDDDDDDAPEKEEEYFDDVIENTNHSDDDVDIRDHELVTYATMNGYDEEAEEDGDNIESYVKSTPTAWKELHAEIVRKIRYKPMPQKVFHSQTTWYILIILLFFRFELLRRLSSFWNFLHLL